MTRDEVVPYVEGLMACHGLKAPAWKFRWNRRRRATGVCVRLDRHSGRIELSLPFAAANEFHEEFIRGTVLHEIAHALTSPKHDSVWREFCARIGGFSDVQDLTCRQPPGPYSGDCSQCHRRFYRVRPPRLDLVYGCPFCESVVLWKGPCE